MVSHRKTWGSEGQQKTCSLIGRHGSCLPFATWLMHLTSLNTVHRLIPDVTACAFLFIVINVEPSICRQFVFTSPDAIESYTIGLQEMTYFLNSSVQSILWSRPPTSLHIKLYNFGCLLSTSSYHLPLHCPPSVYWLTAMNFRLAEVSELVYEMLCHKVRQVLRESARQPTPGQIWGALTGRELLTIKV